MQSTLTSKGQATIPKGIRDHLNLKPGDKVEFVVSEAGEVLLKGRAHSLLDLFGTLKGKGTRTQLTVEQMQKEVQQVAQQRYKKVASGR